MKITMKELFIGGCLFCGYSFFQLLGIVIRGFPSSRTGAIALFILGMLLIFAMGFTNWCGLWYKRGGVLSKDQSIIGFAPSFVFGGFAVAALIIGINAGG
jgi:hypothetical protein